MGFTNHNHSRQFGILHWNVWFWDQMWGEFWRFRYQTWCNIGIYHGTLESKGYCNDHDGWLLWFSESLHWSYDSPIHNKEIWPWNMEIFLTNLSTVFSRVWKNWDHRGNWDDTFTIEISRYTYTGWCLGHPSEKMWVKVNWADELFPIFLGKLRIDGNHSPPTSYRFSMWPRPI